MSNNKVEEIMERLREPFPSKDIEWRVSRTGKSSNGAWAVVLAYVTNRAIQKRLDEVFGPGGWKNEYREFNGGVICTISCLVDGQWVSKEDGAEPTQFESFKGGLSSAMKRAGAQWGIGRYLYDLEETFVKIHPTKDGLKSPKYIRTKDIQGYWETPTLPDWALPESERGKGNIGRTQSQAQPQPTSRSQQTKPSQRPSQRVSQKASQADTTEEGFNRSKTVEVLNEMMDKTGLLQNMGLAMRLLNKALPNSKYPNLETFFQEGTGEEFRTLHSVLKPVRDLVMIAEHYKVKVEDTLQFAQILLPERKVTSLMSLFFGLTIEHVRQIKEMVKEEVASGKQKQTA